MSSSSVRPLSKAMRPLAPGNAARAAVGASSVHTATAAADARSQNLRYLLMVGLLPLTSACGAFRFGFGLGRIRWCHGAPHEGQHLLLPAAERRARRVLPYHRAEHPGLGQRAD